MAATIATNRLRKELSKLKKDPPPGIIAEPTESDMLTWFYALEGPVESPYEGGVYVGKIKFPIEYPMKPPSIMMLTPSGRFQVNTRLCLSMSDFHPESWNPLWSVSSILQGVVSFMTSEELTTGGLKAPQSERKKLARLSMAYNEKHFGHLFDGDIPAAFEEAKAAREAAATAAMATLSIKSESTPAMQQRRSRRTPKSREQAPKSEETSKEEGNGSTEQEASDQKGLTPEEREKRRIKNAKKRAKQKAKKNAQHNHEASAEDVSKP